MKTKLFTLFTAVAFSLAAQLPTYLKTITSTSWSASEAQFLLPTKDNAMLIFGNPSVFFGMGQTNMLYKTDSTGTLKWIKVFYFSSTFPSPGTFIDATLAEDSTFTAVGIVSGTNTGYPDSGDGFCIKFKANGDTLWCRKLYDTAFDYLHPFSISLTNDSGYVVCGMAMTPANQPGPCENAFIAKISKSGSLIWLKADRSSYSNAGYAAKQTPDSGYVMIGGIDTYTIPTGSTLYKFNKSGQIQWSKKYCQGTQCGMGEDLAIENDGFLCLTRTSGTSLLKTDFAGNIIWSKAYNQATYNNYGPIVRFRRLRKLANGDNHILSRNGYPKALITNSTGLFKWAADANLYSSMESAQLKNKSFYFVVNPPHIILATTDSSAFGHFGIVITDSLGTGSSKCFLKQNVQTQTPTFTMSVLSTSFQPGGQLLSITPTINIGAGISTNGCLALPVNILTQERRMTKIYPNPVKQQFYIESPDLEGYSVEFELYDVMNRRILKKDLKFEEHKIKIDLPELPASSYFYMLRSGTELVASGKLIVAE